MKNLLLLSIILLVISFAMGCGEITYPKETLRESVIELCKNEYNVDIDVNIVGRTLAIYLPLTNLFNVTLGLSESAQDKVQDVLLGASRAVLSTDADIRFYCVIAQDIRLPEIQLVVIKYTSDVKRVFFQDISRGEYFKRTLIDINENPQARKEKAIKDVFKKMKLEKEWQDKVLDDFFRSPPSSLEGTGYWNGKFYVKDITLEEFLAQQMASRIKIRFRKKEDLRKYTLKAVTGKFTKDDELRLFLINFNAASLLFITDPREKKNSQEEVFANIFEVVSDVIYGYKFKRFDLAEIVEKSSDTKLLVPKKDVYLFKKKRLPIEGILGGLNP